MPTQFATIPLEHSSFARVVIAGPTVPWRSRSGDRNVDWPGVSAPGLLFVPWLRANRGFTSVGKMLDLRTVDCREASKSWVNSALWPVPPAIVNRTVHRGGCRFRADRAGIGGAPLAVGKDRLCDRLLGRAINPKLAEDRALRPPITK